MASPSAWLDLADHLAVFTKHKTPVVDKYISATEAQLNELLQICLPAFRHAILHRFHKLKSEEPTDDAEYLPQPISDQIFENIRRQFGLREVLDHLGFLPKEPPNQWLRSRLVLSHLINSLREGDPTWRPACAAWLQVASLNTTIGPNGLLSAWWRNPFATAREVLAQLAIDKSADVSTRELATKALANDESILHLCELEAQYQPVILELEIITGRRLWRRSAPEQWELIDYIHPDSF